MNFELYSVSFYVAVVILLAGLSFSLTGLRQGWGVPTMVVLLTVGAWYVGDALYNDYSAYYWEFGLDTLGEAWWQVALFLVTFLGLVKPLHEWINRGLAGHESFTLRTYEEGSLDNAQLQHNIDRVFAALAAMWLVVMTAALYNCKWDYAGLFAPYWAGYTLNPWGRGRIGGQFDALVSLGGYVQIFLTASFGLIWAIARNPKTRFLAGLIFVLTAPIYIFDRTRNKMIAVLVPGAVAWVFLRLKVSWPMRAAILAALFAVLNFWMLFVLEHRGQTSIVRAVFEDDLIGSVEDARHVGLNMYQELAYINQFMKQGTMAPSWGERYWAELVNPIPRALWAGKPTVGLDYAMARGLGQGRVAEESVEGVAATIATGMIGQGVVNFGRLLGPMFAALLMALWVALLTRQDLLSGENPSRFLLYALGIILTFNMGRDITFLVIFPFVCGYIMVSWMERRHLKGAGVVAGNGSRVKGWAESGAAGSHGKEVKGGSRSPSGRTETARGKAEGNVGIENRGQRSEVRSEGSGVAGDPPTHGVTTAGQVAGGEEEGISVFRETGVSVPSREMQKAGEGGPSSSEILRVGEGQVTGDGGSVVDGESGVASEREQRPEGGDVKSGKVEGGKVGRCEGGKVEGEGLRVAGNGGTAADGGVVRTLPIKLPKRVAAWMPRRLRAAVVAEQEAAAEGGVEAEVKGGELRVAGDGGRRTEGGGRPRQLAVPFQNYRRYRG